MCRWAFIEKELEGLAVVVENDVNVAAWGEFSVGACKGVKDMLAVWVGTGIGGGLVLNGELFRGHHLTAGEIGHTVIHADAALGRRTLENSASRTAVVNQLVQLISANHASKITQIVGGDFTAIRSRVIAKALEMDDPLTRTVLEQAARYVGVAIANTVTMLSLPCVVVGGGVTDSLGRVWVEWVRQAFEEHVFPQELRKCRIVASRLGDDAGIVGAAFLARNRLWKTRLKR
ncbi:MAG: ROK family protein [Phycisphaerales bacterium]|nr:ROK family protein [Phycisphaerales bacterium]